MDALTALRHRPFARFLGANTIANIGQFLQQLAVPVIVLGLTAGQDNQNTWVGAAAFAVLVPSVITTPVAGILSDRIDRSRILIGAYVLQSTVTATFLAMHMGDILTPWWIIALQLVSGIAAGFTWPPVQSMSAVLVPPAELVNAVRLVSVSFTSGRAIGPALAGIALAVAGPGLAFGGTLTCYLVGLAILLTVKLTWEPSEEPREGFLTEFRGGLGYIRQRRSMMLTLQLSFITAAFAAVWVFALSASVVENGFGVSSGWLGALLASAGIGSAVASVWITGRGGRMARSRVELIAATLYVSGLLITAATGEVLIGVLGYLVIGFAHMSHGTTMNTTLQVQVEEAYRGRVISVWLTTLLTGLPIGSILGGYLSDRFSPRLVMAGAGTVMAVLVALTAARTSGLAALDEEPLADEDALTNA